MKKEKKEVTEQIQGQNVLEQIEAEKTEAVEKKDRTKYKKKKEQNEAEIAERRNLYQKVFSTFTNTFFSILAERDKKWELNEAEKEGLSNSLQLVADKYAPEALEKYSAEINLSFWIIVIVSKRVFEKKGETKNDGTDIIAGANG